MIVDEDIQFWASIYAKIYGHQATERVACAFTLSMFPNSVQLSNCSNDYVIKFLNLIQTRQDVHVLRCFGVVLWVCCDTSFLTTQDNESEKTWGLSVLKRIHPTSSADTMWSGTLGEDIATEFLKLLHEEAIPLKPYNENGFPKFKLDRATIKRIIEVKTQTLHTKGSAGEKMLGVPFKYITIPAYYKKPLYIWCLAQAEKIADKYYLTQTSDEVNPNYQNVIRKQHAFLNDIDIYYERGTDIIKQILLINQ